MYLVDTSVWIDYLRGSSSSHVNVLKALLRGDDVVGLTPTIEHSLFLLHNDRDFDDIAAATADLKLYRLVR